MLGAITMVGFGEAGRSLVDGWRSANLATPVGSYDVRASDDLHRDAFAQARATLNVTGYHSPSDALAGSTIVFCLVTADQALAAAEAAQAHVAAGTLWFDGNSCSPGTKRKAEQIICSAGGRYVDMAIMAPIKPKRHRTPVLLSGPAVDDAQTALAELGMDATIVGSRIGDASSIKMLRSVMVKGLEALTAECLLAARRAGVESAVLASLQDLDPGFDWTARSSYNLERMRNHGTRRAAEMREVAATLRELRVPDRLATATADWQGQIGSLGVAGNDLADQLDNILGALG